MPSHYQRDWALGYLGAFRKAPDSFLLEFHAECQRQGLQAAVLSFGVLGFTYLTSPQLVQHVLQDPQGVYSKSAITRRSVGLVMGDGLALSNGSKHRRHRRAIMPFFTAGRLEGFIDDMTQVANASADKISRAMQAAASSGQATTTLHIDELAMSCTLDIIGQCGFSQSLTSSVNQLSNNIQYILEFSTDNVRSVPPLPLWLPTKANQQYRQNKSELDNFLLTLIQQRQRQQTGALASTASAAHIAPAAVTLAGTGAHVTLPAAAAGASGCPFHSPAGSDTQSQTMAPSPVQSRQPTSQCPMHAQPAHIVEHTGSRQRLDLLDLLLQARFEDGSQMTSAEVLDEVLTFVLAGHETSANTLTWAMYFLAQHPAVADRARREAVQVCGAQGPVQLHHLPQLQYIEAVLMEALRLCPPVYATDREATVDHVTPSGLQVKRGEVLMICPLSLHRDPALFPDPERYWPERFVPGSGAPQVADLPKGSFLPFGAGARACVGSAFALYEMKVLLATWLRVLPEMSLDPSCLPAVADPLVTYRPKGHITLRVPCGTAPKAATAVMV